jgi:hypothetical protein
MKEYPCELCGKIFNQKCNWIQHTQNKKFPCVKNDKISGNSGVTGVSSGVNSGVNSGGTTGDIICTISDEIKKKKMGCKYCLRLFSRPDSLKRHLEEERCEVLKLQKQQKENIFINLLTEEKIVIQTKNDLIEMSKSKENEEKEQVVSNNNINQIDFLMTQIKLLSDKLDEQKIEIEKQKKESEKQKIEFEKQKMKEKFEEQLKVEKLKIETEQKLKMMNERYTELEKNNMDLKKTNEKLQNKVNKIVNKNTITNNTIINNNGVKLVNFGSEDLDKVSHNVFIETIRSQGAGLYNKAIEGIHFNKDYPENQNIYISDINRGKVMVYKDEKWFLDNWENIYPLLLEQIIQFGYDKNDFLKDCGYKVGDIRYNKQMIKNGLRWYKLLDGDEADIEYFELEPDERPQIDQETYNDYLEMYNFRKKHPKKQTEKNIKEKIKLNMYNKREIPIENYKQIENIDKKVMLIE